MIKHKIITTEKGRLLVVDLPEGCGLIFHNTHLLIDYGIGKEFIAAGNWELLGRPKDVKEDMAEKVVEKDKNEFYEGYKDYNNDVSALHSSKESLMSLVKANMKLRNKYGDEPVVKDHLKDFLEIHKRWGIEEETVFHNPVLFWEAKA